jgi:hypothetical protein
MRNYTEVGKDYEREEIDRAISQIEWEAFRTDNLPFSQGVCLKQVIKACNIPISKISRMALHNTIKDSHGLYGLDVSYKNGQAQIYIADDGCGACVVASDFQTI